jgi:hypothetical protein
LIAASDGNGWLSCASVGLALAHDRKARSQPQFFDRALLHLQRAILRVDDPGAKGRCVFYPDGAFNIKQLSN